MYIGSMVFVMNVARSEKLPFVCNVARLDSSSFSRAVAQLSTFLLMLDLALASESDVR